MDIATIVGVILGISAIIASILLGGSLGAFIDMPSVAVVLGGTAAATLINYPLGDVLSVIGVVKNAFLHSEKSPTEVIRQFVNFAELARKEGILALEQASDKMDDAFVKKGLQLAVDGTTPELIQQILDTELSNLEDRHKLGQGIFEAMGTYAPAFGMIGTLIGLVNMLKSLEDPTQIGAGMAIALITTFYGAVLANLIFLPIAGKLKKRTESEVLVKEIATHGIMGIQSGDNPRVLEEKLKAFLAPNLRIVLEKK